MASVAVVNRSDNLARMPMEAMEVEADFLGVRGLASLGATCRGLKQETDALILEQFKKNIQRASSVDRNPAWSFVELQEHPEQARLIASLIKNRVFQALPEQEKLAMLEGLGVTNRLALLEMFFHIAGCELPRPTVLPDGRQYLNPADYARQFGLAVHEAFRKYPNLEIPREWRQTIHVQNLMTYMLHAFWDSDVRNAAERNGPEIAAKADAILQQEQLVHALPARGQEPAGYVYLTMSNRALCRINERAARALVQAVQHMPEIRGLVMSRRRELSDEAFEILKEAGIGIDATQTTRSHYETCRKWTYRLIPIMFAVICIAAMILTTITVMNPIVGTIVTILAFLLCVIFFPGSNHVSNSDRFWNGRNTRYQCASLGNNILWNLLDAREQRRSQRLRNFVPPVQRPLPPPAAQAAPAPIETEEERAAREAEETFLRESREMLMGTLDEVIRTRPDLESVD